MYVCVMAMMIATNSQDVKYAHCGNAAKRSYASLLLLATLDETKFHPEEISMENDPRNQEKPEKTVT